MIASSHKKFAIVLFSAIIVSVALMVVSGRYLLEVGIGFVVILLGINRHISRCRHCQSWQTYRKSLWITESGPGTMRICRKCGHSDVLPEAF